MKLLDFEKKYGDEEACKEYFKELRINHGIVCPKCGCKHHYWKSSKGMFQCAKCGHRQSVKSQTVMRGSKLPYRYWFIAMHLMTSTKRTFSALELQRQLGHKRYQPVWEIMQKLRNVMGKREEKYRLGGEVEIDEAFFSTEVPVESKNKPLKKGAGSQKKSKVLVMAESKYVQNPKNSEKPKMIGRIKMFVIPNLKSATINGEVVNAVKPNSIITTDASKSHKDFSKLFMKHNSQVVAPEEISQILPWCHITISNAKSSLTDTYHGVKAEFLQGYLNEFSYKFNRRHFTNDLFENLVRISATYISDFKHRVYNRNAA